jgi:lipopolysaccharide transport system permease protein
MTVREPPRAGVMHTMRDAWRYRRLISHFGHRFLMKRYARTWLGVLWIPLRPVIQLSSKILVFGGLVGISAGKTPYPLFFIVTTATWQVLADSATWSVRSIELNKPLLRKTHFPLLPLVLAATIPAAVDFVIYVCLAAAGALYYLARAQQLYLTFGIQNLLVPLGLLSMLMLGLGVGLLTAASGARARDIRFGLAYVLSFLYFLTPVIYPLDAIPEKWRPVAQLNPATGGMEMVKDGLFGTRSLGLDAALVTLVAILTIWTVGLWMFARREARAIGIQQAEPPVAGADQTHGSSLTDQRDGTAVHSTP